MRKTSVDRVQSMFHAIFKLAPFEHMSDALLSDQSSSVFFGRLQTYLPIRCVNITNMTTTWNCAYNATRLKRNMSQSWLKFKPLNYGGYCMFQMLKMYLNIFVFSFSHVTCACRSMIAKTWVPLLPASEQWILQHKPHILEH